MNMKGCATQFPGGTILGALHSWLPFMSGLSLVVIAVSCGPSGRQRKARPHVLKPRYPNVEQFGVQAVPLHGTADQDCATFWCWEKNQTESFTLARRSHPTAQICPLVCAWALRGCS